MRVCIIRDIDTLIGELDIYNINNWLATEKNMHMYIQPNYKYDNQEINMKDKTGMYMIRPFAGAIGIKDYTFKKENWKKSLTYIVSDYNTYKFCYGVDELILNDYYLKPLQEDKGQNSICVSTFGYFHYNELDPNLTKIIEEKLKLRPNCISDGALYIYNDLLNKKQYEVWNFNTDYIHLVNNILMYICINKITEIYGMKIDYQTVYSSLTHYDPTVKGQYLDFKKSFIMTYPIYWFSSIFPNLDWNENNMGKVIY